MISLAKLQEIPKNGLEGMGSIKEIVLAEP
jgi:hypothetical protein